MDHPEYASKNQLANILDIGQSALNALLVASGVYRMRRCNSSIELVLTEHGLSIARTAKTGVELKVLAVKALADLHIDPEVKFEHVHIELPDQMMTRNQLVSLIGCSFESLTGKMLKAGLLCKNTRNRVVLTDKAAPISRMNAELGTFEFNAKKLHSALAEAGQL